MDDARSGIDHVLLTGATGFIGGHLQTALAAAGYRVTALVRPDSPHRDRVASGVGVCEAALDDGAALTAAVADADLVIYAAGAVRGRDTADFEPANVDGLRNIVSAVRQAPRRPAVVLISSLAASRPALSAYAASKAAGEAVLAGVTEVAWTILRPPAVYGPGDREMRPLFEAMRRGFALRVGPREQRLSLLYAVDLAAAVCAVTGALPRCHGRTFDLDDGRTNGYGWPDILAAVRGQRPALTVPVPRCLLMMLAGANLALARVLGYRPMLTPGKVRELSEPAWLCNNHALSTATGWAPRFTLESGVRATFASHGLP